MANKPNYPVLMDRAIASLGGARVPLLLHACFGPCSTSVLEVLCAHFDVTILYYNPNIWPPAEYRRRADELAGFLARAHALDVKLVEDVYDPAEFYAAVQGLENEPERGGRCTVCYRLRMERAARYAKEHGFGWFTTTLSVSRQKDPIRINQIGEELAARYGLHHLPSEFRKRDGNKRSLELTEQYGLYKQDYCGCEFSARRAGVSAPE